MAKNRGQTFGTGKPSLEEEGHVEVPVLWVACLFTFFIGFAFAIVMKFVLAETQKPEITPEQIAQNQNWLKENTIAVSAEVLDSLGIKLVDSQPKKSFYVVFGNNNKGFSVYDNSNEKTVYSYDGMPGDGVMVEVPASTREFIFNAKY